MYTGGFIKGHALTSFLVLMKSAVPEPVANKKYCVSMYNRFLLEYLLVGRINYVCEDIVV